MEWERRVNATLRRTIGYHLSRPPGHPARKFAPPESGRLLKAPVFILSPARAGSTLLRMILGSHSTLYAPPELPLRQLTVRAETKWIQASMKELQLTQQELDFLLWDRVLADTLKRSGKPTVVVKTPSNVLIWQQLAECWPDARFIFLLRHPANAVVSLNAAWAAGWHPTESGSLDESAAKALRYMTALEEARRTLPGRTVRYEDLTAEPEAITRQLCEFLKIRFEPAMLEYGEFGHGRIAAGLGDTSEKLRSGRIQAAAPPPDVSHLPDELLRMCATWGYMVPRQAAADATETAPATAAAGGSGELATEQVGGGGE
jgi:hypothetical protein